MAHSTAKFGHGRLYIGEHRHVKTSTLPRADFRVTKNPRAVLCMSDQLLTGHLLNPCTQLRITLHRLFDFIVFRDT